MHEPLISTFGVLRRRFDQRRREEGLFSALSYIIRLCFSVLLTPWYRIARGRKTFTFRGRKLRYFVHWYNTTFDNERAIEIPIALAAISLTLQQSSGQAPRGRILEVGNVLSHYVPICHDVLDKYERGEHIIHEDVADFSPTHPYDLIISLSTLEHVGFEEEIQDRQKIFRAMQRLRSALAPDGRLLATIPVGFNPHLAPLLLSGELFDRQHYFVRTSASNRFEETSPQEALSRQFNYPYSFGNGIVIGLIGPWPEKF